MSSGFATILSWHRKMGTKHSENMLLGKVLGNQYRDWSGKLRAVVAKMYDDGYETKEVRSVLNLGGVPMEITEWAIIDYREKVVYAFTKEG